MYVELLLTIVSVIGVGVFYWAEIEAFCQGLKIRSIGNPLSKSNESIGDIYYMPEGLNQGISRLI